MKQESYLDRREHEITGGFCTVGDIHGTPGVFLKKALEEVYPKTGVLNYILLGDIGVGFSRYNYGPLGKISKRFASVDERLTCYVFRGNHDRPACFRGVNKTIIEERYPNIKVLGDFDTIKFDRGLTGIVVPGAVSVDRVWRDEGKEWWQDELPIYQAFDEIEDKHYDFVFSHSGPEPEILTHKGGIIESALIWDEHLAKDLTIERDFWEKVYNKFRPAYWFLGHYHVKHSQVKGLCTLRYHDIDELICT